MVNAASLAKLQLASRPNRSASAYSEPMAGSIRAEPSGHLVGRDAETELLDTLIAGLGDGGVALVVRGDAGMGKSAMLQRVRERAAATGARTLTTVGVESEAELAFAGLHQLLHPVLGLTEQLPAVQRRALQAAVGLGAKLETGPFRPPGGAFPPLFQAAGP